MIFHIPGLQHTQTNKDFLSCAFTQKVLKLCKMLTEAGHTVYHYGCEGSEVVCTEHVDLCTNEYRRMAYPTNEDRTQQYKFDMYGAFGQKWNAACAAAIAERIKGPGEFLLCAWGLGHKPIADLLEKSPLIVVESGIGYIGTFARFRVFESAFHMAWTWGREGRDDGDWWSTVIPNFFDPDDFTYRDEKDGYLLYLGRLTKRKGVELASDIAKATGHRLVIAGQGTLDNEGMVIEGPHIDFVGYADQDNRRTLLANAKALLCPTYYIEPFGGVAVEAQMSGTPVICTDWGGFKENVIHQVTGYRCTTFADFCDAVCNIEKIRPDDCYSFSFEYHCSNAVRKYERYFEKILSSGAVLPGKDWYSLV